MLEIKKKATQPPPPLPKVFTRKQPEAVPQQFSEETLTEIEHQIQRTAQEIERLKEHYVEIETKTKLEFELAQQEIEELKFKIRHGEMKG